MENTAQTSSGTTPAFAASTLFEAETHRVRGLTNRLIDAFEAAEVPKDYAGIARAARALLSLNRLIKSLYEQKKAARKPATQAEPALEPEADTAEAETSVKPAPMLLNRHERRRIAADLLKQEKLSRMASISPA